MSYTKDNSISFPTGTYGRAWVEGLDPTPNWTVSTRVVTATRQRTGDRLPNWRQLIANGEDATTSLTGTLQTVDYDYLPTIHQTWKRSDLPQYTYQKYLYGDLMLTNAIANYNWPQLTVDPSFVDNMARAAFYKKVHALTRQFQGLVFLGELTETLHMLRRPALGLQNIAKDFLGTLRKRKRADPKRWTKDLAGAWLEQAFGWTPLINDCKDAANAWRRYIVEDGRNSIRVSAGAKKMYDTSSSLSSFDRTGGALTNPNLSQLLFRVTYGIQRETVVVRYRGAVQPQVEAPLWKDASLFGFNPREFVPTAWELLPWSFLVDYFTNIGDLLDASVTSVNHTSYVCRSEIHTAEKHRWLVFDPNYRGGVSDSHWKLITSSGPSQPMKQHYQTKTVRRTRQSGVSAPSFQFNFDLSDGQLGNCAALLAQANALHPQKNPVPWKKAIYFPH